MNLLKIAVGMNFLAAALFLINGAYAYYDGQSHYWKFLVLSLLFLFLGLFYRRKQKRQESENQ